MQAGRNRLLADAMKLQREWLGAKQAIDDLARQLIWEPGKPIPTLDPVKWSQAEAREHEARQRYHDKLAQYFEAKDSKD